MIDEKQHRWRCARLVIERTSDRNNSTFAQCLAGQGISARNEKKTERARERERCVVVILVCDILPPSSFFFHYDTHTKSIETCKPIRKKSKNGNHSVLSMKGKLNKSTENIHCDIFSY
jgi:hypothetical protein